MVISWQLNKAEEKTKQHSNNKKLFPRKNVVYLLGCTSCPNGVILYIYIYLYIYKKTHIKALNQPAVTKIYWKGVNTGVLNEHQELQQGSRQSKKRGKGNRAKSRWWRKEANWWGKKWHWLTLVKKSCWLRFFPRTSQLGPGSVTGRSCHKYHFCHDKSFVTASIFCHDKRHFFVVTNTKVLSWQKWYLWQLPPMISEQHATLTDSGCKNNGHLLTPYSFKKGCENPLKVHLGDKHPLKLCMKTPDRYLWTHVQPWSVSHYQTPKH